MITSELPAGVPDVLVVDDDAHVRQALGDLIADAGLFAMFADNGAQALRYAAIWQPRLILLDIQMPVLDGRGFLERRRLDDRLAEVPVVVISSEPVDDVVLGGVQAWVPKPFDGVRLVRLVEHLLQLTSGGPVVTEEEEEPTPPARRVSESGAGRIGR